MQSAHTFVKGRRGSVQPATKRAAGPQPVCSKAEKMGGEGYVEAESSRGCGK